MLVSRRRIAALLAGFVSAVLTVAAIGTPAQAKHKPQPPPEKYEFATPVFGLATWFRHVLVADAGAGIVKLNPRNGAGRLLTELPGVTDIAPILPGIMVATTGQAPEDEPAPAVASDAGAPAASLMAVVFGHTFQLADLAAFEADVNPDGGIIESNPQDLARAGLHTLVADAAGNSLVDVAPTGKVDWVATFPTQIASTQYLKDFAGCPNPDLPPDIAFVCDLPPAIPAEAVPTTVAVGPDGAYYVGELVGFPGTPGMSRIWRVERGTRHAECGSSPKCEVVASGFTSIIDIDFARNGKLYVVELDEAGWLLAEQGAGEGGTVNRCNLRNGNCREVATDLTLPTAVAVGHRDRVYVAINALIPGAAEVITLS